MTKIKNAMCNVNKHIIFDYNTGFILRKIYGETRLHIDNISEIYDNVNFIKENKKGDYKMIRNSSMVFTLNDDYEGGMFNFPYYDITVKLKKGSVIIFPPFWTHEHQVYKVENNTYRYTLSTWTCAKI
jgi:predicted 2-oxoglutarate/Fe(II)-dependent dioxygenase YbiX